MSQYLQHNLRINENPYLTICHSLGGIHKVIQILETLVPRTEFFAITATRNEKLKPHHIKQYRFVGGAYQNSIAPFYPLVLAAREIGNMRLRCISNQ